MWIITDEYLAFLRGEQPPKKTTWQCLECARINSLDDKVCTNPNCGWERKFRACVSPVR
jgi:hypothetical protein